MTPDIIDKKGIFSPEGGWKDETYYIVEVAYGRHNVIHKAIFFSGFCNDAGVPSGYNWLMSSGYEELGSVSDAFYLKAIAELPEDFQIER